jgi:RNA polymerase sigma-70 factor (ECF subfamily)
VIARADQVTPRSADAAIAEAVEKVLEPAMRGDPAAVAELLRPVILRYCRARLGSSGVRSLTADDVAQEACIGVLRALPRYRRERVPFLAYVYGICANKIADAWRRRRRVATQRP